MDILPQDTALLFKVTHSKPIEMKDFVATMNSLANLFEEFTKEHADSTEGRKAKLYVEKIEQGCIEMFLQEVVTACALPFMENINIIMEFAEYLGSLVHHAIKGDSETKLSISELKDLSGIFSINAADPNGKTEFGAVQRQKPNMIFNSCTFNFGDSNVAQNQIKRTIEEKEQEIPLETVHERQLMTIYQMRGDMQTNIGNKAVIDILSRKPLSVVFETEELKRQILNNDENPTKKAFLVDVIIQTIGGKPTTYKVLALHDIVPLDD